MIKKLIVAALLCTGALTALPSTTIPYVQYDWATNGIDTWDDYDITLVSPFGIMIFAPVVPHYYSVGFDVVPYDTNNPPLYYDSTEGVWHTPTAYPTNHVSKIIYDPTTGDELAVGLWPTPSEAPPFIEYNDEIDLSTGLPISVVTHHINLFYSKYYQSENEIRKEKRKKEYALRAMNMQLRYGTWPPLWHSWERGKGWYPTMEDAATITVHTGGTTVYDDISFISGRHYGATWIGNEIKPGDWRWTFWGGIPVYAPFGNDMIGNGADNAIYRFNYGGSPTEVTNGLYSVTIQNSYSLTPGSWDTRETLSVTTNNSVVRQDMNDDVVVTSSSYLSNVCNKVIDANHNKVFYNLIVMEGGTNGCYTTSGAIKTSIPTNSWKFLAVQFQSSEMLSEMEDYTNAYGLYNLFPPDKIPTNTIVLDHYTTNGTASYWTNNGSRWVTTSGVTNPAPLLMSSSGFGIKNTWTNLDLISYGTIFQTMESKTVPAGYSLQSWVRPEDIDVMNMNFPWVNGDYICIWQSDLAGWGEVDYLGDGVWDGYDNPPIVPAGECFLVHATSNRVWNINLPMDIAFMAIISGYSNTVSGYSETLACANGFDHDNTNNYTTMKGMCAGDLFTATLSSSHTNDVSLGRTLTIIDATNETTNTVALTMPAGATQLDCWFTMDDDRAPVLHQKDNLGGGGGRASFMRGGYERILHKPKGLEQPF